MLDALFGSTGNTNWMQECARALLIFAYGLLLVRVGGRRLFAQWSALDIVVAIVMGSSLSRALTGNADLFGTLAAMTLLVALHRALFHACARWHRLSIMLEGVPVRLVENGRTDRGALIRHGVSGTHLAEALRSAGIDKVTEAKMILLEPNGKITVLKMGYGRQDKPKGGDAMVGGEGATAPPSRNPDATGM